MGLKKLTPHFKLFWLKFCFRRCCRLYFNNGLFEYFLTLPQTRAEIMYLYLSTLVLSMTMQGTSFSQFCLDSILCKRASGTSHITNNTLIILLRILRIYTVFQKKVPFLPERDYVTFGICCRISASLLVVLL